MKKPIPKEASSQKIEAVNLHNSTVQFSTVEARAFASLLCVIPAVGSVLNWQRSCALFLADVLNRLGDDASIQLTHAEFAQSLWPSLPLDRSKPKLSKLISGLRGCQTHSRFCAVEIISGKRGSATEYRQGQFYEFLRGVQDRAIECDMLALPLNARRTKLRAIVKNTLFQMGAIALPRSIDRQKSKVEETAQMPNEDFHAWLEKFHLEYRQWLCETGEISLAFRVRVKNVLTACDLATSEARALIQQVNKSEREI